MQEARTAAGFNNVDFVQFDGRYTNNNTFGGARKFDLTGAIANIGASALLIAATRITAGAQAGYF